MQTHRHSRSKKPHPYEEYYASTFIDDFPTIRGQIQSDVFKSGHSFSPHFVLLTKTTEDSTGRLEEAERRYREECRLPFYGFIMVHEKEGESDIWEPSLCAVTDHPDPSVRKRREYLFTTLDRFIKGGTLVPCPPSDGSTSFCREYNNAWRDCLRSYCQELETCLNIGSQTDHGYRWLDEERGSAIARGRASAVYEAQCRAGIDVNSVLPFTCS
jgi:hypothetical protein